MKSKSNTHKLNWTNQDHILNIIRKILFELTGYDGKIKIEHSISKDLGIESLDWIDFFIKLQNHSGAKLNLEKFNSIFRANPISAKDSFPEVSLLSRLKVADVLFFLEQQLHHPLNHQDFIYANWKEKFFPQEQSYQPTFQSWTQLANSLLNNNKYLRAKSIEANSKELEILEFFWNKDELGILVLEDALNTNSMKFENLDELNAKLDNFLDDENQLYKLRLELATKCLHHADNTLNRINSNNDEWLWIIEDFISDNFNSIDLKQWLNFTDLKTPENKNEKEKLTQIISNELEEFIATKMNQAMSNPAAKADRIQNTRNLVNPIQKRQNYLQKHFSSLIEEFLEIFTEELIFNTKFKSISKSQSSINKLSINQYNSPSSESDIRFEKLVDLMTHTHSKEPDAHKSNPQKSNENFQEELRNLREKWRSPLNFLIRFPQLGSIRERISLLMTTQGDWEKFLDKNIRQQSERLKIIFFACKLETPGWTQLSFENYFLKTVLNWQDLQLKLKKQNNQKLILRIEDVWAGIELTIGVHNFSALDIFMRFGLKIFEHDSPHKLFKWISGPTDQDLINLTEASEIQSLNRFM